MWASWENMNSTDRIVRLGLGVIFIVSGLLLLQSIPALGWPLTVIGALLLIAGGTGFCFLYRIFGNYNTLDQQDIDRFPAWRHHHSECELPRRVQNNSERRFAGTVGRSHQTGITRDWVWKESSGLQLRSSGVYRAGHTQGKR